MERSEIEQSILNMLAVKPKTVPEIARELRQHHGKIRSIMHQFNVDGKANKHRTKTRSVVYTLVEKNNFHDPFNLCKGKEHERL